MIQMTFYAPQKLVNIKIKTATYTIHTRAILLSEYAKMNACL